MNNKTKTSSPLPVLISRNAVVFPGGLERIELGRAISIEAAYWSQQEHEDQILIVCQKTYDDDEPTPKHLYQMGTLCKIIKREPDVDNSMVIYVEGVCRAKLEEMYLKTWEEKNQIDWKFSPKGGVIFNSDSFWLAKYKPIKPRRNGSVSDIQFLISELLRNLEEIFGDDDFNLRQVLDFADQHPDKVSQIVDLCAQVWPIPFDDVVLHKQQWLETVDVKKRIELILRSNEISNQTKNKIDESISRKVHNNISKQQKEFYLRERIKVIKEELGENPNKDEEISAIRERLKREPFPPSVKQKVLSELNKLDFTASFSNEAIISRNYIDWVMSLPWWEMSKEEVTFEEVSQVLNKNHYGLEKPKDRILDFLSVQRRKGSKSGATIICLVGPPGVGKTSLVISIAQALKRKFVKISLGGISDESEIRGHRKTYIGSMPGRILKGMKKAGVKNPVFLLDEIDKLTSNHRGDPSGALLEVLDPAQNKNFSDNYIEEDYDLSQVMFIATANYEENIPDALYDRMEVIHLTSYTEKEKLEIAKTHLIEEILKENNIKKSDLKFTDEAINYIIARYTREAGVRNLKRLLSTIARKLVRAQELDPKFKEVINIPEVQKYLKKEIYEYNTKDTDVAPGIVNGMAYTEFGGDLLPIEVTYYKGTGKINITGNLKQVMQESVTVALSHVKSNAKTYGVDKINFEEIDLNIHVPSGAVPKDGPSAGIALTSAIISALTKIPVDSSISMTGEITLQGKVLIIGGVKEKVISAVRGGVNKIFLPKDDERYLDDVPAEILAKTKIVLVKHYLDVFKDVFGKNRMKSSANKPAAMTSKTNMESKTTTSTSN
ncbi:ATP-dependent Lon protease [Mycoplasmoides fastidiosum]|uniref:Lon protease n=1 Tax=Mycoplasmoides fastidiosum TaxID=92758 RepID=A0ABU0LY09_9BACT|nr:endopeptidase La [Mycoplasmoides fastidiosum]MDQ0513606.1 ATP-dependent Lon protease [Mycoplasmoides fastidiosum]UUD37971.1 endopeptidase La [Mycoplasmoides fastidiosum]